MSGQASAFVRFNPYHDKDGRFAAAPGGGAYPPSPETDEEVADRDRALRQVSGPIISAVLARPDRGAALEETLVQYVRHDGYERINGYLRHGSVGALDDKRAIRQQIGELDELFTLRGARTTEPQTVFRGIGSSTLGRLEDALRESSLVQDEGFSSTSLDPLVANDFAHLARSGYGGVLQIEVPVGTSAVYVPGLLGHRDAFASELELLLPRGTVYQVRREGDGYVLTVHGQAP